MRMFVDLGLLSAFNIDTETLCRWLLTVKRNYRNDTVKYHNWFHAFNVAQMMFCMLRTADWSHTVFEPVINGLCLSATAIFLTSFCRQRYWAFSWLVFATIWTIEAPAIRSKSR